LNANKKYIKRRKHLVCMDLSSVLPVLYSTLKKYASVCFMALSEICKSESSRLANITSPLPRMTSHAVHEAMVGTTTDLRKVKTALLSVFNKDGLEEFGLFLQAQGVTIGKLKMFVRVTCACQILNFLPQFLLPVLSSLFFTLYSLHGWHGQKTSCCRLHRGGCL
jgi:hypothetical protein